MLVLHADMMGVLAILFDGTFITSYVLTGCFRVVHFQSLVRRPEVSSLNANTLTCVLNSVVYSDVCALLEKM